MTLADVNDTIQILGVVGGLYIAFRGVDAWRTEMAGRRNADLAESMLAMFYEAKDYLAWVRVPMSIGNEGTSRPDRKADEPEQLRRKRDAYYTPIERMNKQTEFWSRFHAGRYRFQAVFGAQSAQPFDEFRQMRNDVIGAAHDLLEIFGELPDRAAQESRLEILKLEQAIGWGVSKHDELRIRATQAVTDMEIFCRPHIDGYHRRVATWWKWPRRMTE